MSKIVGHRGYPQRYPENTLLSMHQAIAHGAQALELDIQISQDNVPMLCHDVSLKRVFGSEEQVFDLSAAALRAQKSLMQPAFLPAAPVGLCSLAEFASSLQNPAIEVFIEIKAESYQKIGNELLTLVLKASEPIASQRVLISFELDALAYAKQCGAPIGLIVDEATASLEEDSLRQLIGSLNPEVVCANIRYFANGKPTWAGDFGGKWMCYCANDAAQLAKMRQFELDYIETDCVKEILCK